VSYRKKDFRQKGLKTGGFCLLRVAGMGLAKGVVDASMVEANKTKTRNTNMTTISSNINGIDTEALVKKVEAIKQDSAKAQTHWEVTTRWKGGARSDTEVKRCVIGGEEVQRDFTIKIDEPLQLLGTNKFANPQEYLLAALNACLVAGYAANCAHEGIELEELSIQTEGDIDLRGFLGLDATIKPGYDTLRYTVQIKGNATPQQFEQIHQRVTSTSPNYFNISQPVTLKSRLVVKG
jgi:uncharacterized OsmC-like protein